MLRPPEDERVLPVIPSSTHQMNFWRWSLRSELVALALLGALSLTPLPVFRGLMRSLGDLLETRDEAHGDALTIHLFGEVEFAVDPVDLSARVQLAGLTAEGFPAIDPRTSSSHANTLLVLSGSK